MIIRILCFLAIARLAGAASFAQPPAEIQKAVCEATVSVNCRDTTKRGSGVVLGTKDSFTYVLTAQHVVANAKKIEVNALVSNKSRAFADATVLWSKEQTDLALIRFTSGTAKIASAPLGECSRKAADFPILKTSWKGGDNPICKDDQAIKRVLVKNGDKGAFFWQTKGMSEEGESGGGMFSIKGELLGICSGNQQGIGYFTWRDEIYFALKIHSSSSFLVPQDGKE